MGFLDDPCSCWPWKEPLSAPCVSRLLTGRIPLSFGIGIRYQSENYRVVLAGTDICDVRYPDLLRTGYVRVPDEICVHGTDGGSLLSHDMNTAASAKVVRLEYPVQFVPPHAWPGICPCTDNKPFWSLCGHFSRYSVNDPHHLGGGLLAFLVLQFLHSTSVCLSRAIRKSDRLDFLSLLCPDCPGLSFFVSSILYSFSGMSIMMSKIVLSTLTSQRRKTGEFFFSSSNSFCETPFISCSLVSIRHFLFFYVFPSQVAHIFQ